MGVRLGFVRFTVFTAAAVFACILFAGSAGAVRGSGAELENPSAEAGYSLLLPVSGGAGAQSFVQDMASRAITFLGDSSMSMESKKTAFRELLQESFDMRTIGRFSLGRYWRIATPEQRQEYQKLFEDMIIRVYSSRFSDYQGQIFEARSFRTDGDTDTIVTSFVIPDQGSEIQVDWRVRYKKGKYKVVDVIVEGVSMSVTQRSDFSSVIQRGGGNVQVLIDYLRSQ